MSSVACVESPPACSCWLIRSMRQVGVCRAEDEACWSEPGVRVEDLEVEVLVSCMTFSEGGGTSFALAILVQLGETGPHALFPSFLALSTGRSAAL